MGGRELGQFTVDFTWYMRNLLLVQAAEQVEDVLDVSTENRIALEEEAKLIKPEVLMRYIRIFSELTGQMKYSSQKRVLTEIALIKLTKPEMEKNYDSILNRLSILEKKLEEGIVISSEQKVFEIESKKKLNDQNLEPRELQKAVPKEVQEAVNVMPEVIQMIGAPVATCLRMARFQAGGENRLLVVVTDEVAEGLLNKKERREQLGTILSNLIGKEIQVDIKLIHKEEEQKNIFLMAQKNIDTEIQEEE